MDNNVFYEEFECFGIDLNSEHKEDIIDKVKELCGLYKLNPETFVAEWLSFAHSSANDINPTIDLLADFQLKHLAQKECKPSKASQNVKNFNTMGFLQSVECAQDVDEMCTAYSTPTAKMSYKRQLTPEITPVKKLVGSDRTGTTPFSPATFSPSTPTPSKKYGSRQNAGEVVLSYGTTNGTSWRTNENDNKPSNIVGYLDKDKSLIAAKPFMFQKLTHKAEVLCDVIDDIGEVLMNSHKLDTFSHVALPVQDEVTVVGRICCDSKGKLNDQSILLQGSRSTSGGRTIMVDVSNLDHYSFFPGQVVAMKGVNISGQKCVATHLYEGCPLPKSPAPSKIQDGEPINCVIACGPFSTSDNLCYEPLADFLKYVNFHRPHVVIMLGPFVDVKNSEIEKCMLNVTFEEHFNSQMQHLVDAVSRRNGDLILVPSYRDVHHDYVYPQPPYHLSQTNQRVHCVSDPCFLTINDTNVAITSSDILFHLGAEEIAFNCGSSGRITRLVTHVINQHSMYPLYPPSCNMNIDYDNFERYATLSATPDILLLPSDLPFFIKDVSGCCCVNPGRLTKGLVGGTFTRMIIPPNSSGQEIKAEILRI